IRIGKVPVHPSCRGRQSLSWGSKSFSGQGGRAGNARTIISSSPLRYEWHTPCTARLKNRTTSSSKPAQAQARRSHICCPRYFMVGGFWFLREPRLFRTKSSIKTFHYSRVSSDGQYALRTSRPEITIFAG